MVRRDAASNRTEDLNVKVCEEVISTLDNVLLCCKALVADHWRRQEQKARSWLEAISRHRDAAIGDRARRSLR